MMENLTNTAEQVDNAEPISAHPDKLKDQLSDNKALIEDLDKKLAALDAVRATADELMGQAGMDDEAARGALNILFVHPLVRLRNVLAHQDRTRNLWGHPFLCAGLTIDFYDPPHYPPINLHGKYYKFCVETEINEFVDTPFLRRITLYLMFVSYSDSEQTF